MVSLDLKGNELEMIEDGAFANLPSLKLLDLSSNRINRLLPNTFAGSFNKTVPPSTRVLYLYGTCIGFALPYTLHSKHEIFS